MERLAESIEDMMPLYGSLSITEACQIGIQMIKSVKKLHELGYIHKDLKLNNVMIKHGLPDDDPDRLSK